MEIWTKGKYLKLWGVYPLLILSATRSRLPADLEAALLNWLWHHEGGMYYVYGGCLSAFPPIGTKEFPRWLNALDVIAAFPTGRTVMDEAIAWLWTQRSANGWWDFGAAGRDYPYFPLSNSWRQPPARQIDSSAQILTLLYKYYAA